MNRVRVFIVEDSFVVSLHLRKLLESVGYHVLGTADSGEQALEQIQLLQPDLRPDIVLLDVRLNGPMDGIETGARIRQELNVPIIYITALLEKEIRRRAKETEPFGYLTKPFDERDVFQVIETTLKKES